MKINQGQNPVPLEQPRSTENAHQAKAAKGAKAGHLSGNNLNVGRHHGGHPVRGGQTQGIPKPVLNPPNQDPTVASYQAALGGLDQVVAQSQSETLAGDLSDLADALEEAAEEGGGDDGGVVIGTKNGKSRLRRINVLASDVRLKNTDQEQAKDLSQQLRQLGRDAAKNPEAGERMQESMSQLRNMLKGGDMDGSKMRDVLKNMHAARGDSTGDAGKSGLMQQLQSAGKPQHNMAPGVEVGDVTVMENAKGFSGKAGNHSYSTDFSKKTMSMNIDGNEMKLKFKSDGSMTATVNGSQFPVGKDETSTYSQFFMLMALFHEMGVEQRKQSRQGRNMANKAVVEKIKAQAQEQKSAAAAKLVAGTVSGSIKVASASMTMAGSMKGLKADQAAAQAGSASRPGDMISRQYQAMGQMFEGLGEAASSTLQYKAALHEAAGTELRAEEEQARFVKQTEQDQMQVAQELSSKARDTFAQTWNQFLQTQQNITRNI
ncbi:type III secretion system translocon subunit SctB [Sansalvadorimonas sp. 2012CJ34-2]|uniref:Type III secretion system translocon subunit SctB n=1 Tax=Parendozoicomonas callyspongiae TaxID=2942213 RepID=A0ABT0PGT7_9GAMM|nr:type III secretion system translocon subunit SctB [Sansalvadorimonas sp. 2012CJ34-2]MCL6270563.1 type III secretion system translocon subunit SctB [Sansalvadorimonas sp. 2012CJ34-2]